MIAVIASYGRLFRSSFHPLFSWAPLCVSVSESSFASSLVSEAKRKCFTNVVYGVVSIGFTRALPKLKSTFLFY